jgi:hypothetical protein
MGAFCFASSKKSAINAIKESKNLPEKGESSLLFSFKKSLFYGILKKE